MDLLQEFQELFIVFSQILFDHGCCVEAFPPVAFDFLSPELFGNFLDFFFIEVFLEILEFVLGDVSFA